MAGKDERKIRYAVVGAGWICQAAFMPGVAQTGNSELTACGSAPGRAQELTPTYRSKRPLPDQRFDFPPVSAPKLIGAEPPQG